MIAFDYKRIKSEHNIIYYLLTKRIHLISLISENYKKQFKIIGMICKKNNLFKKINAKALTTPFESGYIALDIGNGTLNNRYNLHRWRDVAQYCKLSGLKD